MHLEYFQYSFDIDIVDDVRSWIVLNPGSLTSTYATKISQFQVYVCICMQYVGIAFDKCTFLQQQY